MLVTVGELIDEAAAILPSGPGLPNPRREARWLLGHVLGRAESSLLAHCEAQVSPADAGRYRDWVQRRARGEPAHYIVGLCPFCQRDFEVTPAVLIPRPETEMLVARALELTLPPGPMILDLGTGSGCVAITLALELPGATVVASDLSLSAGAVARRNASRHGARILMTSGDLGGHFSGGFDLVVANLPYVPIGVLPTLPREILAFEPHVALNGGPDGTALVRRLLCDLPRLLRRGGLAVLEIGAGHAASLTEAISAAGLEELARVSDLARVERLLALQRP